MKLSHWGKPGVGAFTSHEILKKDNSENSCKFDSATHSFEIIHTKYFWKNKFERKCLPIFLLKAFRNYVLYVYTKIEKSLKMRCIQQTFNLI